MEQWDAITVGAGVGGLSAAARMAAEGRKVLVIDRNPHPGGTAYVYTRVGFSFPMGPLGFSSPGLVRKSLAGPGAAPLEMKPVHYRVRAFGLDLLVSRPFAELQDEMAGVSPRDAPAIKKFFEDVAGIAREMKKPAGGRDRALLEKAARTPARRYLEDSIEDARLRRVLGSIGTSEPYSSMALLAAMWELIAGQGVWYPTGGMKAFCDRLAAAVTDPAGVPEKRAARGRIMLNREAQRIRVENNAIKGVVMADGEILDAPVVVSNADYKTTFLKLLEQKDVPEKWRRAVDRAGQTMSNLQVCLCLDAKKADLSAFKGAGRIIYRKGRSPDDRGPAPDWSAAKVAPGVLAGQELEVSLWSADDESLAPPGKAALVIRTEAEHGHFAPYRPAPRKRTPEYKDYKTRLAKALVREAAGIVPGLEDAVELMDVATPLTFEERGGRSRGAVAGWSWEFEDSREFDSREMVLTPIAGLYMAGYQAFSSLFMGGVPTAMVSGEKAAEAAIRAQGPVKDVLIPGSGEQR